MSKILSCLAILLAFVCASSTTQAHTFDAAAELPRVSYATSPASTPTPGAVTFVPAGANLQLAINNAQCGDILQLQAGATFTGVFTFPAKNCVGTYVQVRTSSPDGVNGMPGVDTRITPCRAGIKSLPGRPAYACANPQPLMARIIAPKDAGPIVWADGASNYRLGPGLEITRTAGTGVNYNLIAPTASANHIIIDRNWIHGTTHDDTTRGILLSGMTYVGIVNNYMSDFHCAAGIGACVDSQAIAGGAGGLPQGVWKIENNFLEAAAENILFGGTKNNSVTPWDISIRHNHLFKPPMWKFGQPGFVGGLETSASTCPNWDTTGTVGQCPFVVKNLLEFKNAQRVLVEDNIMEYSWSGFTQHGGTILVEGANSCVTPTYSSISVQNITIRFNKIAHAASGLALTNPGDFSLANCPISNISAHDNLFDDLNANVYGDSTGTWNFEFTDCLVCTPFHDLSLVHNTEIVTASKKTFLVIGALFDARQGISISNNLTMVNTGVQVGGSGYPVGTPLNNTARLDYLFSVPTFAGNVLIGGTANLWPAGNFFPVAPADVMFQNYNNGLGGDYTLSLTSPYKNAGTDGTDPGANVAAINLAIRGVN